MKDLVQVHNKGKWIRYSGVRTVIGHATFLGITSRKTPLKENMKGVWIEVSLFPLQSLPLTGYSNIHRCLLLTLNSKALLATWGGAVTFGGEV